MRKYSLSTVFLPIFPSAAKFHRGLHVWTSKLLVSVCRCYNCTFLMLLHVVISVEHTTSKQSIHSFTFPNRHFCLVEYGQSWRKPLKHSLVWYRLLIAMNTVIKFFWSAEISILQLKMATTQKPYPLFSMLASWICLFWVNRTYRMNVHW